MDIKVITGADPAAGAEVLETVPADKFWRVLGLRVALVTDVTVANRTVRLDFLDATTAFWSTRLSAAQTASSTSVYSAAPGIAEMLDQGGIGPIFRIPELVLPAGFRIVTSTGNLQAGDNFSAPVLYVAEFDSLTQALTAL